MTGTTIKFIFIALLLSWCGSACRDGTAPRSSALGGPADTPDSLRLLIINQPDFTAEESRRFSEEKLIKELKGFSASYRIAKMGPTYRRDRGSVISYERSDRPAMLLYPRSHEYVESPQLGIWFENAASPGLLAVQDPTNLVFQRAGESEIKKLRDVRLASWVTGP